MTSLVLDLLIIAVIALFAILGWQKGLVLTLCGLLAVFVAYIGAVLVTDAFSEEIASILQPPIQNHLERLLETALPPVSDPDQAALPGSGQTDASPQITASLEQVLDILRRSPLLTGMYDSLSNAVKDGAVQVATTAVAAASAYLALQLSRSILFFLTFFFVITLWALFSRALDLACRLPVLRTFNEVGGMLIGLVKGLLILLVVVGLLSLLGIVPEEIAQQTFLYRRFMNFQLPSLPFP